MYMDSTLEIRRTIARLTTPKKEVKEPKVTKQYFVTRKTKSK
jgi:hypothetical protein